MTKIKSGTNTFTDNDIYIGDGGNTINKRIFAENGFVNKPYFKYNYSTSKWEISHNGTNTSDLNIFPGGEPCGFENRTDSQISFNDGYRRFSIGPKSPATSWNMWYGLDNKITKTETETLIIPNSVGSHFIYYNSSGVLSRSGSFPGFNSIFASIIYWDGSKGISISDERHGLTMDWATHEFLHSTVGTRYQTGFALTNILPGIGANDANAQITIDGGTIWDEDIKVVVSRSATPTNNFEQELGLSSTPGKIPVFYRSGVGGEWTKDTATNFPMRPWNGSIGNRIGYNLNTGGTWSVADPSSNGRYVAVWIVATTSITEPIIAIMGQKNDINLANAQANNLWESMSLGDLPFQELKILYRLIIRTSTAYGNSIKAYIENIQDLRSVSNLPAGTYVASDHGSLSGRTASNSHPSTAISTDTTNFNNILSVTDTDVQLSLDTIDDHTHAATRGGTGQTTYSTGDLLYASATNTLSKRTIGSDGYVLTVVSGVPNWQTTNNGWQTALDLDFSAEGNQTLSSDTNYTIGGKTWTKQNSAKDRVAMAVTNGQGLVINPAQDCNYYESTRDCPLIWMPLSQLNISNIDYSTAFRITLHISSDNPTGNYHNTMFGIDNDSSYWTNSAQRGKGDGYGLRFVQFINQASTASLSENMTLDDSNRVMTLYLDRLDSTYQAVTYGPYTDWGNFKKLKPLCGNLNAAGTLNLKYINSGPHGFGADTSLGVFIAAFWSTTETSNTYTTTISRIRIDYKL